MTEKNEQKETKKIRCKKCGNLFETEIIRIEKEVEYCTNDINDVRSWKSTRKWSRVKHSKCQQCRNMQKACDYINGLFNK